jgi:hypothetical protein
MVLHKEVILIITKDIFEVSKFISNHPGEGISDVYLKNYHKKNVTEEYEHYHHDEQPDEWLELAKKKGYDSTTGIYYVCPAFFQKKIPSYFHFFINENEAKNYLQEKNKNKIFILQRNEKSIQDSIQLMYIDESFQMNSIYLTKKENKWINYQTNEIFSFSIIVEGRKNPGKSKDFNSILFHSSSNFFNSSSVMLVLNDFSA